MNVFKAVKQAIHEAIADNYDGMYLGDGAVDQVVRQYGMERVGYILANTLHHKSYDGRFSHGNKEWAEQVSTPEHNADRMPPLLKKAAIWFRLFPIWESCLAKSRSSAMSATML